MKREDTITLIGGILVCFCVTFVFWSVLDALNDDTTMAEFLCEDMGGTWIFYECQNIPFSNVSCAELKTGYWCEFANGTSLNATAIGLIFNSSTWSVI